MVNGERCKRMVVGLEWYTFYKPNKSTLQPLILPSLVLEATQSHLLSLSHKSTTVYLFKIPVELSITWLTLNLCIICPGFSWEFFVPLHRQLFFWRQSKKVKNMYSGGFLLFILFWRYGTYEATFDEFTLGKSMIFVLSALTMRGWSVVPEKFSSRMAFAVYVLTLH